MLGHENAWRRGDACRDRRFGMVLAVTCWAFEVDEVGMLQYRVVSRWWSDAIVMMTMGFEIVLWIEAVDGRLVLTVRDLNIAIHVGTMLPSA